MLQEPETREYQHTKFYLGTPDGTGGNVIFKGLVKDFSHT